MHSNKAARTEFGSKPSGHGSGDRSHNNSNKDLSSQQKSTKNQNSSSSSSSANMNNNKKANVGVTSRKHHAEDDLDGNFEPANENDLASISSQSGEEEKEEEDYFEAEKKPKNKTKKTKEEDSSSSSSSSSSSDDDDDDGEKKSKKTSATIEPSATEAAATAATLSKRAEKRKRQLLKLKEKQAEKMLIKKSDNEKELSGLFSRKLAEQASTFWKLFAANSKDSSFSNNNNKVGGNLSFDLEFSKPLTADHIVSVADAAYRVVKPTEPKPEVGIAGGGAGAAKGQQSKAKKSKKNGSSSSGSDSDSSSSNDSDSDDDDDGGIKIHSGATNGLALIVKKPTKGIIPSNAQNNNDNNSNSNYNNNNSYGNNYTSSSSSSSFPGARTTTTNTSNISYYSNGAVLDTSKKGEKRPPAPDTVLASAIRMALPLWKQLFGWRFGMKPRPKASPAIVLVSPSAPRAIEMLKLVAIFKTRVAKCFAKHMTIEEQYDALMQGPPVTIAVGTPNRLAKLVELGMLNLDLCSMILWDLSKDAKGFHLFDALATRDDSFLFFRDHLYSRVVLGQSHAQQQQHQQAGAGGGRYGSSSSGGGGGGGGGAVTMKMSFFHEEYFTL